MSAPNGNGLASSQILGKRKSSMTPANATAKRLCSSPPPNNIWNPLDKTKREIRLAVLQPSKTLSDQPICTLRIVSLDEKPRYEALSYAWGDANITRPIMIQGVQWPVTVNLEAGLRQLRYRSVPRTIWIDAICIDQSSTEERKHQVQLMKLIYGHATVVRVWLGEEGKRSKEAMWALEQIARKRNFYSLMGSKVIKKQDLKNLIALLQRPWWSRVWVLQEVVLAKKVSIHCGGASLGTKLFESLVTDLEYFNTSDDDVPDDIASALLGTFLYHLHGAFRRITYWLAEKRSPMKDRPLAFTMTLGLGVSSHCSDPRDSIYGFLGLVDGCTTSGIKPDYTISALLVFQNTAVKLTLSLGSLLLFSLTKYRADRITEVPSWVPDWQRIGPRPEDQEVWESILRRSQSNRLFCADGSRPMTFDLLKNASVRLSGLLVDQVTKKSSASIHMYPHLGRSFVDYFSEWRQLCYSSGRLDRDDANSHFVRLVTNDMYEERAANGTGRARRCSSEETGEFRTSLSDLEATNGRNTRPERCKVLLTRLFHACTGRCLFLTAAGYAGLGPPELQVGDSIYALAGGRKLYVLRPVPGATHLQTFNLIGDCYVQGIMDGEAVRGRDDDFHDVFIE